MLKSKKFWSYDACQSFDLKQEVIDAYKFKGRIYEDINYFYDLIGVNAHPGLKMPHGREHTEPNSMTMVNVMVDINTLKILFAVLSYARVVTLKFCSNGFDYNNLEFLINSLLNKPNNIYNFVYEWNDKIKIDGIEHSFGQVDEQNHSQILKAQQLICKLGTSTKLEALCLRGNLLGDEAAILLFETLKTNQSLRIINLYKNKLTKKCVSTLCSMLELNRAIEEINLGANHFTDEDLSVLKIHLGKFPMTTEDLEAHNKKVKERDLIIQKNVKLKIQKKPEEPVPMQDEVALIDEVYYVIKNVQLRNLNLMQNEFTENCFESILSIIDSNPDLLITMDGGVFNKAQKELFTDPYGKYASRIYLTR